MPKIIREYDHFDILLELTGLNSYKMIRILDFKQYSIIFFGKNEGKSYKIHLIFIIFYPVFNIFLCFFY
jgi:hypothetical protein